MSTVASSDEKKMVERELADARALIERGEAKAALKPLERVRRESLAAGRVEELEEVLALAALVYGRTEGKRQGEAGRLAFSAQQNIRFLGRRAALAQGREWVDPFAPAPGSRVAARTGTSPRPGFPFGDPRRFRSLFLALLATLGGFFAVWMLAVLVIAGSSGPLPTQATYQLVVVSLIGAELLAFVLTAGGWWRARRRYPVSERGRISRVFVSGGVIVLVLLSAVLFGIAYNVPVGSPSVAAPRAGATGVIAFDRARDGGSDIWTVRVDGSAARQFTRDGRSVLPAWSPDGRRIVFASARQGRLYRLYVMNGDGSEQRVLGTGWGGYHMSFPAWSPDGRSIAFTIFTSPHQIGVVDGDLMRFLFPAGGEGDDPAWSPDGRLIAFSRGPSRAQQIYVVAPNGGGLRQLTTASGDNALPTWSPDGSRIGFASTRRDGYADIYLMNRDGTDQHRLTDLSTNIRGLSWSADGTRITFASQLGGDWQIYVVNSDGTDLARVTNGPESSNPAWKPNPRTRSAR